MIKLYDRVKQTTYSIGTGDIALSGAIAGFSTFSSVYQNNDSLFYCITDGINYEIGSGLYVSSSNSIKRYSIKSTNSDQLVNFGYGLKEIYVNYPATNSVINTYGASSTPQNSGIAFWTSSNSISYNDKFIIDSGNSRIGINKSNPTATIDIGGSSATSSIKASGFFAGNSGIYFPSGNNGISSYSGGRQLVHFEPNQLSLQLSHVLELSGIVNQNIVLKKQNAGTVFAGPPSGCSPPCDPAYPNFRPLTLEDIPDLSSIYGNYNTALSGVLTSDIATVSGILNSKIDSASGSLNNRIDSFTGIVYAASGAVNSRITAVSGYLNTKIDNISVATSYACDGRLSINSGNPIVEGYSDSLYFVPYNGNLISLYNGTTWQTIPFSTTLVKTTSTLFPFGNPVDPADRVFDIFAYLNNGSVNFESVVWTSTSQRTTQLNKKDGIYVKSGDDTRRYIGSVMPINYGGYPPAADGNQFNNTINHRYIYNYYNRIPVLSKYSLSRTWTCGSNVWRQLLNTYIGFLSSITINILCGIQDDIISPKVSVKLSSQGLANTNYMLTINSSNFDISSIGTQLYVPPTPSTHLIDILSADSVDYIEKQLYASMTEVVPVGISTYYVAEKVPSGKNSPNLTFDYNNGIFAEWRC